MEYNFREIEKKWQKRWVENKTYQVTEDETKKKFYVLNQKLMDKNTRQYKKYELCPLDTLEGEKIGGRIRRCSEDNGPEIGDNRCCKCVNPPSPKKCIHTQSQ